MEALSRLESRSDECLSRMSQMFRLQELLAEADQAMQKGQVQQVCDWAMGNLEVVRAFQSISCFDSRKEQADGLMARLDSFVQERVREYYNSGGDHREFMLLHQICSLTQQEDTLLSHYVDIHTDHDFPEGLSLQQATPAMLTKLTLCSDQLLTLFGPNDLSLLSSVYF